MLVSPRFPAPPPIHADTVPNLTVLVAIPKLTASKHLFNSRPDTMSQAIVPMNVAIIVGAPTFSA